MGGCSKSKKGDKCQIEERTTPFVEAKVLKQKGCKGVFSKSGSQHKTCDPMMEAQFLDSCKKRRRTIQREGELEKKTTKKKRVESRF